MLSNQTKTKIMLKDNKWLRKQTIIKDRDGKKKMIKSDPSDASRINLTDTKEEISIK